MLGIQWVATTKIVKTFDTNLHGSLQSMICQQVVLSGDAEWPKVADAVIEAVNNTVILPFGCVSQK